MLTPRLVTHSSHSVWEFSINLTLGNLKHNADEMDDEERINEMSDEDIIKEISVIMTRANPLDEPREIVKNELRNELRSRLKNWYQCNRMTMLNGFGELRNTVRTKLLEVDRWVYIGYTGGEPRNMMYLWYTTPKSQDFPRFQSDNNLVKTHTYYARLNGIAGETEKDLIQEFLREERCLNIRNGLDCTTGIVYALVYGRNL